MYKQSILRICRFLKRFLRRFDHFPFANQSRSYVRICQVYGLLLDSRQLVDEIHWFIYTSPSLNELVDIWCAIKENKHRKVDIMLLTAMKWTLLEACRFLCSCVWQYLAKKNLISLIILHKIINVPVHLIISLHKNTNKVGQYVYTQKIYMTCL